MLAITGLGVDEIHRIFVALHRRLRQAEHGRRSSSLVGKAIAPVRRTSRPRDAVSRLANEFLVVVATIRLCLAARPSEAQ